MPHKIKVLQRSSSCMCETLDEIHAMQLAAVIAKMRREAEKPLEIAA